MTRLMGSLLVVAFAGSLTQHVIAQQRPDPAALMAKQRHAVAKLDFLDGTWRGSAVISVATGQKLTLTQTERVGSMLGGSIKIIEGRGYDASGSTVFHAVGVVSLDATTGGLVMRAYADGQSGDFPVAVGENGFSWEIPAGPGRTRYVATVKDGKWSQVGEFTMPNREPVRVFEMNLTRLGDTQWPAGGEVPPK
jgi:hypothetical protein